MDYEQEKQFLAVKQKLDNLRLPTSFPLEVLPLLAKLLNKLENATREQPVDKSTSVTNGTVDTKIKALTHELQKTVRDNNQLHLEHIHLKEEIQVLLKKIAKLQANRKNPQEQEELLKLKNVREAELESELRDVKKKHNDLLDRAYNRERGLQGLGKEYDEQNVKQEFNNAIPPRKNFQLKENARHVVNNRSQEAERKTADNEKVSFLQEKIKSREEEIKRLHKKLEFDGLNMNKMLKDFNEKETADRLNNLNHQLNLLVKENKNLTEEMKKVKGSAGHAEVLRKQVETLKEKIADYEKKAQQTEQLKDKLEFNWETSLKKVKNDLEAEKRNNQTLVLQMKEIKAEKNQALHEVENIKNALKYTEKSKEELRAKIEAQLLENRELLAQVEEARNIAERERLIDSYKASSVENNHRELFQKYNKLTEENGKLVSLVREHETKTVECQRTVEKAQQLLEISRQESKLRAQQISNLEEAVIQQNKMLEGYKRKAEAMGSSAAKNTTSAAKERSVIYQQKLQQAEDARQRLEKEISSLQRSCQQHVSANDILQIQVTALQRDLEEAKIQLVEQTRSRESAQHDLRRARHELEECRQQIKQMKLSETNNQTLKSALRKSENNVHMLKAQVESVEEDRARISQELQEVRGRMKEIREGERRIKNAKIELEERLEDIEGEKNRLAHDREEKARRMVDFEEKYMKLQSQLQERDDTIDNLGSEVNRLKKDKVNLEKRIQQLQTEKQEIELGNMRNHSSNAESRDKDEQIYWLKKELAGLLEKVEKYAAINKDLADLAAVTKKENEQLVGDYNVLIKEIDHLRFKLGEMERALIKAQQREHLLNLTIQNLERKNGTPDSMRQNGYSVDEQSSKYEMDGASAALSSEFKQKLNEAEVQYARVMNTYKQLAQS